MKPFLILLYAIGFLCQGALAEVVAIKVESRAAGKTFPVIVTLPSDYQAGTGRYACIYMLHCAGADEMFWNRVADLQSVADRHRRIVVAPSTGPCSWFVDYADKNHSGTFITKELIPYIDKTYRTSTDKRWIAGFSMGGHGALYLGLRHPGLFSSAGAIAGCVSVSQWGSNWGLEESMGPAGGRKVYDLFTPDRVKELKGQAHPLIYMVCGNRDFFYPENRAAHQLLEENGIAHEWLTNDGRHGDYLAPSLLKMLGNFEAKAGAAGARTVSGENRAAKTPEAPGESKR